MKRILTLAATLACCLALSAQARYGTLRYEALLRQLPEYARAQQELTTLREKYQAEASYNETAFKRQFAEFLQGQKDFPHSILLKRQRDLQDAMERGVAYRQAADSLLAQAEQDLLQPARRRLDAAIDSAASARGYDLVVNLDAAACPYVNPQLAEDATPFVLECLKP